MHEKVRHDVILSIVSERPVAAVSDLTAATGASEATIRRDIAALDAQGRLRRVRGGAEATENLEMPRGLAGPSYTKNIHLHSREKQAIAHRAADMCVDGETVVINGGTTTFQMVHRLATKSLQVMTNSFPIAEHLLKKSQNAVSMPGGMLYREHNIILSPFTEDATQSFWAKRMFMGAYGVGPKGVMEADPLLIQAELKLIDKAEELVLLADSSKFNKRSSLVLCPIERLDVLITDDGISDTDREWIEAAGVSLIIVPVKNVAGGSKNEEDQT